MQNRNTKPENRITKCKTETQNRKPEHRIQTETQNRKQNHKMQNRNTKPENRITKCRTETQNPKTETQKSVYLRANRFLILN